MKNLKNIASVLLGLLIVFYLVRYLQSIGRLDDLNLLSAPQYGVSFILLTICFFIGGIQTCVALKSTSQTKLSLYDMVTLPVIQNFWGFVIPFQGALIYGIVFLKAKYKADIRLTTSISLFITITSLVLGSLVGSFYCLYSYLELLPYYLILAFLPLWLILFQHLLQYIQPKRTFWQRSHELVTQVLNSIVQMSRKPNLVIKVLLLDIFFVLTYAFWSYYLSEEMMFQIPFIIHVLVAFMMKLSLLFKLTPGNMGITQLFTGGLFSLYGYSAEFGLLISTLQFALLVVLFFPVAIVLSVFQAKYIKALFKKGDTIGTDHI